MKTPTRSPTHEDVDLSRLSSMGLEVEELADGAAINLAALVDLAEDRGRPVSHYLAAAALQDIKVATTGATTIRVCAGTCQRWGALDLLDHLVARWEKSKSFTIAPVSCLDRCDQAAACEVDGPHGKLVIAPATKPLLDEALSSLAG